MWAQLSCRNHLHDGGRFERRSSPAGSSFSDLSRAEGKAVALALYAGAAEEHRAKCASSVYSRGQRGRKHRPSNVGVDTHGAELDKGSDVDDISHSNNFAIPQGGARTSLTVKKII